MARGGGNAVPHHVLRRLRAVVLVLGGLTTVTILPAPIDPLAPAGVRWAGVAAAAAAGVSWIADYRRGRSDPTSEVVDAAVIALVGSSMTSPTQAVGLVFPAIWFRLMVGTHRRAVIRMVTLIGAFLVAVGTNPTRVAAGTSLGTADVLGPLLPIMVTAVVVRALVMILHELGVRGSRETALAIGTRSLVGDRAPDAVASTILTTAADITVHEGPSTWAVGLPGPDGALQVFARAADQSLENGAFDGTEGLADPGGQFVRLRDGEQEGFLAVRGGTELTPNTVELLTVLLATGLQTWRRVQVEQELHHRAWHDPLTGLTNRAGMERHLAELTARHADFAIALIDLDDFKVVNDAHGHAAGDELLTVLARRLRDVARNDDVAVRLGGDEFALVLPGVRLPADAMAAAERVVAALIPPIPQSWGIASTSASVGVALSADGVPATETLRQADSAMYAAKSAGKNRAVLFSSANEPARPAQPAAANGAAAT